MDEHYPAWQAGGDNMAVHDPIVRMERSKRMMPNQVRVGVIGTSSYTDRMHLTNLKSHPCAHIAAICGRNLERAQALAQQYEIPAVYTDYQEMLSKAKLDAVVIATPDDLHYAMTMAALDAGLHVLCEKPLALTRQQAEAMAAKAAATGVKHMTFFSFRWTPLYRYLHQLIQAGYVGRPYLCNLQYLGSYGRDGQYLWRFDGARSNGILGDSGSHMIDLLHWWLGDITKVSATLTTFLDRVDAAGQPVTPTNDSALLLLEFANGARGTLVVSAMAHLGERGLQQHLQLFGEAGTLEAELTVLGTKLYGARQDQSQLEPLPIPDELLQGVDRSQPFLDQFFAVYRCQDVADRQFIDAIVSDLPISPNFKDGLKAQAVIDAALESHRRGCWIPVGASDQ
jgi:predicted dehydrogenase